MSYIKLMKGIALRKHSLHEKTAAWVLLKLVISNITNDATPLTPLAQLHFVVNIHVHSMIPEDQKHMTTQ